MMSREMENCVYVTLYMCMPYITYNNEKEIWKIQKGYRYRSDGKIIVCAYNNTAYEENVLVYNPWFGCIYFL